MGLVTSVVNALFGESVSFIRFGVPLLTFDASLSEIHKRASPATEFEIENGQTISDHIVVKPFELHLQVLISNDAISGLGALGKAAATTALTKLAPNPAVLGANAAGIAALPLIPDQFSAVKTSWNILLDLQWANIPFTVITSLKAYQNMWIKDLSAPRDSKTGNALVVDIQLQQLLIVSSLNANLSAFSEADIAANEAAKGAHSAEAASESEAVGFFKASQAAVINAAGSVGL